ncbi:MAG: hypothetical protein EA339_14935 [Rhodobacteraceae bacterium]|nr:MAG: hypothetical protein EA339_14935 [Paracoccaceae bacterium]
MSTSDALRRAALLELLPNIHRQRDAERGAPLRALLGVLADQGGRVEDDILGLLDDWFIETCDEWVVPYIGDLLGVRGLQEIGSAGFSRRSLVANTLAFRRGKGTARVIEQLAQDATGWRALAREMFLQLAGTQHMNHLRPDAVRTPDLRDSAAFDPPQGPFGQAMHMVDVRSVALGRGRFNIPNIAVFLWRLQAYRITAADLTPEPVAGRYRVSPAGIDAALFNPAATDAGTEDRTGPRSVPAPLRRRALHDELEARRQALAAGRAPVRLWFDERAGARMEPAFRVELDGADLSPDRIAVCDLSDWTAPADTRGYDVVQPDGSTARVQMPLSVAVDPELGRVVLAPSVAGAVVRLTYSEGFAGDIGALSYSRRAAMEAQLALRPVTWAAGVSARPASASENIYPTLAQALAAWRGQPAGTVGMIAIMDSARHVGALTGADAITVPEGSRLILTAADWPAMQDPDAPEGVLIRRPGQIDADRLRPVIVGDLELRGTAPATSDTPGTLLLDGVVVQGGVTIAQGALGQLDLTHCTVMPGAGVLQVGAGNAGLVLSLRRSIVGDIAVAAPIAALRLCDSVAGRINAAQTPVEICDSTVLGALTCLTLDASGALLTGITRARRLQTGCVRYSWIAPGSVTPRPFRCQPQLALSGVPVAGHAAIIARLRPAFTSAVWGEPGFAQLARSTEVEIAGGGEDGSEMGAFRFLAQPARLSNLRNLVPEYLPYGQEYGLVFET